MASQLLYYCDGPLEPKEDGEALLHRDGSLIEDTKVVNNDDQNDQNDLKEDNDWLQDLDDDAWERVIQDFCALVPTYGRLWAPLHRRAADKGDCATCCKKQGGCQPASGGGSPPPSPPRLVIEEPPAATALGPKDGSLDGFLDPPPYRPATIPTAVDHHREEPGGSFSPEVAVSEGSPPGAEKAEKNRSPLTRPSLPAPLPEPDRTSSSTSSSGDTDHDDTSDDEASAKSSPCSSESSGDSTILNFDHISFEPSPTAQKTAQPLDFCRIVGDGPGAAAAAVESHRESVDGATSIHAAVVSTPPTTANDGSIVVLSRSSASPQGAAVNDDTPELQPRQRRLGSLEECLTPFVTVRKKNRNHRTRVSTPPEEGWEWQYENHPDPDGAWTVGSNPRDVPPSSPIQVVGCSDGDGGGDEVGGLVLEDDGGTVLDEEGVLNDGGDDAFRNRNSLREGSLPGPNDSDIPTSRLSGPLLGTPLLLEGKPRTSPAISTEEGCSLLDAAQLPVATEIASTDGIVHSSSPSGVVIAKDDNNAAALWSEDEVDERPHTVGATRPMRRPFLDPWDSDSESPDKRSVSPETTRSAEAWRPTAAPMPEATSTQWRDLFDTSSDEDEGGSAGPATAVTALANRLSLACMSPRMADALDGNDEESDSDANDRKCEAKDPNRRQWDTESMDDDSSSAGSGFDVSELINRTKVVVLDSDNSEPYESSDDSVVEVEKPTRAPPSSTAQGSQSTKARPRATATSKSSQHAFLRRRQALAQNLFCEFDRQAFDGALVRSGRCTVEWSKTLRSTAGLTRLKAIKVLPSSGIGGTGQRTMSATSRHEAVIELSLKVLDCEERLRNTLVHEMCHAAAWLVDGNRQPPHGPVFHKWANQAMRRLPDIQVTTTHTYEISFKYAWQCQTPSCGKVVQRHSRSVDVQRQCCGSCHGGQLVLVRGGRPATTDSDKPPPKPSDYQLFVREHGPAVRQQLKAQGGSASQSDVFAACAILWQERKAAAAVLPTASDFQRTHDG